MIALYKDPQGNRVLKGMLSSSAGTTTGTNSSQINSHVLGSSSGLAVPATSDNNSSEVIVLREKLSQMKKKLKTYEEMQRNCSQTLVEFNK